MASIPVANLALVTFAFFIFAVSTASSAKSSTNRVPFNILAVVTASAAIRGKSAVPIKSPANFSLPLTVVEASGVALVTLKST